MSDCLGCQRLSDPACNTVVLLTGETVCSWCPEWRVECATRETEARAVLRLPTKDERLSYLATLELAHGTEFRRRVEVAVLDLWELKKARLRARGVAEGG